MRGLLLAAMVVAALPATASAQSEPTGWDGTNPFLCTIQNVATGTDFPNPEADPFCVEFDKTHQNVDQLGVVDFLSKEPARVAAASDKCFYFQSDHWRGTVSEGVPESETYAWDGHYYFNKATGAGGVYVENFRFGGQSGDPTVLPGFPEEWKPYFSQGRGGVQAIGDVQADPRCAAKPNPSGPGGGSGGAEPDRCRVPGGRVGRGIAGVRLGMKRSRARRVYGVPVAESTRWLRWCLDGGGRIVAAFGARGERARAHFVLTNSPPFDTHGVRVGMRRASALKRLRGERRLGRARDTVVFAHRERHRRLLVGMRARRVAFLAVGKRSLSRRRTLRYVRNAPPEQ
jgi:hypothetical protein